MNNKYLSSNKDMASNCKPIGQKIQRKTIMSSNKNDKLATEKTLIHFRNELKSDISSLESNMNSKFAGLDSRFNGVDSKFNKIDSKLKSLDSKFKNIDSKFSNIDSKFDKLNSKIDKMNAKTERTLALYEQTRYEIKFISESNYQNSLAIDQLKILKANKSDIL